MNYPADQNWLLFRTQPGSVVIPAGESVRLTADLPNGISVADYKTIRIYARSRPNATVPVTISILVLDRQAGELIFALDLFVLQSGDTVTRTYDVPGRELVVFATAGAGLGGSGVDFGVLGFGPRPCAYEAETEEAP
jgi:hypothetical protein